MLPNSRCWGEADTDQRLAALFLYQFREDLTKFAHFIAMPGGKVWNMRTLSFTEKISPEDCVYTTAIAPDRW